MRVFRDSDFISGAATPMLSASRVEIGGSQLFWFGKRAFDLIGSLVLLPVLAFAALIILLLNPFLNRGPLFFRQERLGRHMRSFKAFKFRSMAPDTVSARGVHEPLEHHRITPLGKWLRRLRIDELPQILNVLRGEMSLIGPRPDALDHAMHFASAIPGYAERHAIRPGISGLAQVTSGYAEGLEATAVKAALDHEYMRNAGIGVEFKVICLTLRTVFGMCGK